MQSCRFTLDSGKYQGLFGLDIRILAQPTVAPKYKPNSPSYFSESSKNLYDYIQGAAVNVTDS